MAAVNNYVFSSAYAKLQYIAVTGGVFCVGKVELKRGKLIFTSESFEVSVAKFPEFLVLVKKLGENLTWVPDSDSVEAQKNDKSATSAVLASNLSEAEENQTASGGKAKEEPRTNAQSARNASQIGDLATKYEQRAFEVELATEEEIRLYKTSICLRKKGRHMCSLFFNHFTYMSFLERFTELFPFTLNPTPRQYDLIVKFQQHLLSQTSIVHEKDFVYPIMTKTMTAFIREVCSSQPSDFCRTELFMQKHYIGLNLSSLYVFYELGRITGMFRNEKT